MSLKRSLSDSNIFILPQIYIYIYIYISLNSKCNSLESCLHLMVIYIPIWLYVLDYIELVVYIYNYIIIYI